jgi:hypothetical protein|tara:strand:+ start:290 stop:490 length:201 start_codon:yes stop_codon:yes gene_type:complete
MTTPKMYLDLELKNQKQKDMITVYEEHIETLEKENKSLNAQILFLKEQLNYKTFGKPCYNEEVKDK